jgi:hypothetical protein
MTYERAVRKGRPLVSYNRPPDQANLRKGRKR